MPGINVNLGSFGYRMKVIEWRSFLVEPTKPGIGKGYTERVLGQLAK